VGGSLLICANYATVAKGFHNRYKLIRQFALTKGLGDDGHGYDGHVNGEMATSGLKLCRAVGQGIKSAPWAMINY